MNPIGAIVRICGCETVGRMDRGASAVPRGESTEREQLVPLFELDESGSRLVQPMQPAATSFGPESAELVTNHVSELLGEGLFPVATRRSPDDEQPHMLALDVVGQPVVIEVVAELDADALIQALAFAGQAGRFTSSDLARLYHGGAEQFGVDVMAFRESLPAAYSRRGLRVGARLLLVCSTVSPEIADALDFLRAPGRQVEVMQMGVVHGAGGRRYLDVSPLAGPIAEMRQVEQANLRLVRSKEAFAAAMAYDEERKGFARFAVAPDRAPEVGSPFAATGTDGSLGSGRSVASPVSGPVPAAGPLAEPARPAIASPASPRPPAGQPPGRPPERQGPATPPPRTSAFAPPPVAPPQAHEPPRNQPPAAAPSAQGDGSYTPVFVPAPGGPLIPPNSRPLPDDDPADDAPATPVAAPRPAPGRPLGPPMALSTGAHPLGARAGQPAPAVQAEKKQRPDAVLAQIAGAEGPFELVWFRERRGQRFTATLRTDGLIELPDGEVFADPDEAARAVSHAALSVDGWGVWRLGDGGPPLRQMKSG